MGTSPAPSPEKAALPIVLAITGASGMVYAIRLLQALLSRPAAGSIHLTVSDSGAAVLEHELQVKLAADGGNILQALQAADRLLQVADDAACSTIAAQQGITRGLLTVHSCHDYFTPIASGSFLTGGMVICPCSGSTLSGIAHAASQNLIQRAAEVHLKEHRKLIVVPRETPLSAFQLENMQRLARAGVVVLPAAPGWYHGVHSLLDLVDFVVARILDQLGIENTTIHRWASEPLTEERQPGERRQEEPSGGPGPP